MGRDEERFRGKGCEGNQMTGRRKDKQKVKKKMKQGSTGKRVSE